MGRSEIAAANLITSGATTDVRKRGVANRHREGALSKIDTSTPSNSRAPSKFGVFMSALVLGLGALAAVPGTPTTVPGAPTAATAHAAEAPVGRALEDTGVTLRHGGRGPEVATLQQALRRAGFLAHVDGTYGPQTREAVRSFQREAGIAVDGVAGPETLTLLYGRYGRGQLVHVVERGESLWELAQTYDVTVEQLRELNGVSSDTIRPGERLRLPEHASLANRTLTVPALQTTGRGADTSRSVAAGGPTPLRYVIQSGDSLSALALRFGSSVEEIAAENGIASPSQIRVGEQLIIPIELRGGSVGDARLSRPPRPGHFVWPVEGPISSPYGVRVHPISGTRDFHSGLDVAVPTGTPVRAAYDGIVREARWIGDLGLAVVIDHGNGITTRYGHNSKLLAKPGERVRRGEIISESGSTGMSTGPHVHFMVLRNGETMNPSDWLP